MRRALVYAGVSISLVIIVPLMCLCCMSQERKSFYLLWWHRREASSAQPLADGLSRTSEGIRLALADFDVFGGSTRGWSSYVLRISPRTQLVENGLRAIVESQNAGRSRSIEAAYIMWQRTGDPVFLETILRWVASAGDSPAVERGRSRLASAFDTPETWELFKRPGSEALNVDAAKLRSLLASQKSGNGMPREKEP